MSDDSRKYTKKSIMAFLEGQPTCDEKWVVGVINASSLDEVRQVLTELSGYGNPERLEFLKRSGRYN